MTRPQNKPSRTDKFIREHTELIVDIIVSAPSFLGAFLCVWAAQYIEQNSDIRMGVTVAIIGIILMLIAVRLNKFFED